LPVLHNEKLSGVISETDLLLTSDFGHATVDQVMTGAIVIESESTLSNALSKMRKYNISRLPVINKSGILIGTINALDISKLIAKPRDRPGKSPGIGTMATIRNVQVRDIMKRPAFVERGTTLNAIIENFRTNEEVIIVGNKRPIGIVTPKDALELTLPKQSETSIHIANLENTNARQEISNQITPFLKKIQNRITDIQNVIIYADKHKTNKYSLRSRIITARGTIDAKAVGYDPVSACKTMISKLDRQIRSEHSQKVRKRQRRDSARRII
jgi:predicted transcriptional regulator/ribosome-associated translation inhibitor RaiA